MFHSYFSSEACNYETETELVAVKKYPLLNQIINFRTNTYVCEKPLHLLALLLNTTFCL